MSTTPHRRGRRRLVLCVDGTWCRQDGSGMANGNQTNIFRISASVRNAPCVDKTTGISYAQESRYIGGLGADRDLDLPTKYIAGVFGKGVSRKIRDVYEQCCELDEHDEVWLYGFSRGAFVVRAVAGLLHYIRVLKATGAGFEKDYQEALRIYALMRHESRARGEVYTFINEKTRASPTVKFVGVFDTVKALNDDGLHDIGFNPSIQHMRHALALHEDRADFEPEHLFPDFDSPANTGADRSCIQAWFFGAHGDLGGSKHSDGLSLYPLQWMFSESEKYGLHLGFHELPHVAIDNPLRIAWPVALGKVDDKSTHTFSTRNGTQIRVHDLRDVHTDRMYDGRYNIKLNTASSVIWKRARRVVFSAEGRLRGYQHRPAKGTIIHPSLYFIFDQYTDIRPLTMHGKRLQADVEALDADMLGTLEMEGLKRAVVDFGFWADSSERYGIDRYPLRILVCGDTGVGKSTLINQVFGAMLTSESERMPGLHNVHEERKWRGTAKMDNIIIHDSMGFESASEAEMASVEAFLADRSTKTKPEDRLHFIWFCVQASSARVTKASTRRLFRAIARFAPGVPVIVVATFKDVFLRDQYGAKQDEMLKEGRAFDQRLHDECVAYSEAALNERVLVMETEIRDIVSEDEEVQLELCVAVEHGDSESHRNLTRQTIRCINSDAVRRACIAAQVVDEESKENMPRKRWWSSLSST